MREPKVGHLGDGVRAVEQHVGALDVAVDDALAVEKGEAARDLAAEMEQALGARGGAHERRAELPLVRDRDP